MTMTININKLATKILLEGDKSETAESIKQASERSVGEYLKGPIKQVLKEETNLEEEKINRICDKIILKYIKKAES